MAEKQTLVLSITKAFTLMNCIAEANMPLTLKELSERTGYPKSTTHSILSTLREYHAIAQDDDGKYRLGSYLLELGSAVQRQWNIADIAKPFLQSLCVAVNETVCIAMLDGYSALVLDAAVVSNPMRVVTDVGTRLPLHATAIGKVFLSYMSEEEAIKALRWGGMTVYTPHTLVKQELLLEEFKKIRSQGFAVEDGEMRIGMRAVAAPIFDINNNVRFVIATTGMFRKTTEDRFLEAEQLTKETAEKISKKMR